MDMRIGKIGVVGAGAWGTALATVAHRAGHDVVIRARETEVVESINLRNINETFLPGVQLAPEIRATTDDADLRDCDAILLVVPAQFLRPVTQGLSPIWPAGVPAVICCKGIEQKSGALMSEVARETLPGVPLAVLSGPTFAIEVARGMPTAVTLAADDEITGAALSKALGTSHFRAYRSSDLIGAEIGGAVKNVLAIACGIVEGRNLGDNARAALITRGLAELARLAAAKGANAKTLMGLSGLGDLTLTCNAMQSRNFSLGVALGRGDSLNDILARRQSVAEGVHSAPSVIELAERLGVEIPISASVNAILNKGADIDTTIQDLLSRPVGDEDPLG